MVQSSKAPPTSTPVSPRPADKAASQERALRQVFPRGEIFVVADDADMVRFAHDKGLRGISLEESAELPVGANVVLILTNQLVSRDLRKAFRHAAVLLVPIASFDPALDAAKYTLETVLLTDYEDVCTWSRYWVDQMSSQLHPLMFYEEGERSKEGVRTRLTCSLATDLHANAWLSPTIEPGQWVSVGSLCEVSITAPSSSDWCGAFTVDGSARASGVLVARDPRASQTGDSRIQDALRLRRELVSRAPVSLEIEEGILRSVGAGGADFTEAVREVTNPDYELHTLELGIGTNMSLLPNVDWQFNSQLNEGAGTVHLGYGEGMTGAHMDFVVAQSAHCFQPATT